LATRSPPRWSSLNDDVAITLNAEVFPHVGVAASVLDSADQTARREFSPRTYYRSTANTPPVAYVDPVGGDDATGVVSTTDATAAASPFATISGAIGTTGGLRGFGDANGAIIYLEEGTHTLATAFGADLVMPSAALTIKPASGEMVATIVEYGAAAFRPRIDAGGGAIRIEGCIVNRTGTSGCRGESDSALELGFVDCDLDAGSHNATFGGTDASVLFHGVAFTNLASSSLSAGTSPVDALRGCSGAPGGQIEHWIMLGCDWTGGADPLSMGTRTESGSIVAFNGFYDWSGRLYQIAQSSDVTGAVFAQNVVEFTSETAEPVIAISADGTTGNTTHVILHHNTLVGFNDNGRNNSFYDDGATARTHTLMSDGANLYTQINTKGDIFALDGTRLGNFAYTNGAGCQGNYTLYQDAGGGSFAQDYPGPGSDIGTSGTVMNGGPAASIFTDFQAVTSGPTAGAGGGDYSLVSGAAPKGIADAKIRFDAAGATRSTTTSAGAYE